MNFDASKLSTTITAIGFISKQSDSSIANMMRRLASDFDSFSEVVISEDSNLATTCNNISSILLKIEGKLNELGSAIETELTNYVEATLANESGATQSLSEINDSLTAISASLEAL